MKALSSIHLQKERIKIASRYVNNRFTIAFELHFFLFFKNEITCLFISYVLDFLVAKKVLIFCKNLKIIMKFWEEIVKQFHTKYKITFQNPKIST